MIDGGGKMTNKMNILNRCFTKNWLSQLIAGKVNSNYEQVIDRYIDAPLNKTNGEIILDIYNLMNKKYRNEYIYKNEILNQILLKKHKPGQSTALSELQVGKAIADFAIINGKGVIYEIKTELDNLERLENQINEYYKAFTFVNIVTYSDNYEVVREKINCINPNVGILVMKRKNIKVMKDALEYTDKLEFETIFKMLRKKEFEDIIVSEYKLLPKVSQFDYYKECKNILSKIPVDVFQKKVLEKLKLRNISAFDNINNIPHQLKFLCYSMNINNKENFLLRDFLSKKYEG